MLDLRLTLLCFEINLLLYMQHAQEVVLSMHFRSCDRFVSGFPIEILQWGDSPPPIGAGQMGGYEAYMGGDLRVNFATFLRDVFC